MPEALHKAVYHLIVNTVLYA